MRAVSQPVIAAVDRGPYPATRATGPNATVPPVPVLVVAAWWRWMWITGPPDTTRRPARVPVDASASGLASMLVSVLVE